MLSSCLECEKKQSYRFKPLIGHAPSLVGDVDTCDLAGPRARTGFVLDPRYVGYIIKKNTE